MSKRLPKKASKPCVDSTPLTAVVKEAAIEQLKQLQYFSKATRSLTYKVTPTTEKSASVEINYKVTSGKDEFTPIDAELLVCHLTEIIKGFSSVENVQLSKKLIQIRATFIAPIASCHNTFVGEFTIEDIISLVKSEKEIFPNGLKTRIAILRGGVVIPGINLKGVEGRLFIEPSTPPRKTLSLCKDSTQFH